MQHSLLKYNIMVFEGGLLRYPDWRRGSILDSKVKVFICLFIVFKIMFSVESITYISLSPH